MSTHSFKQLAPTDHFTSWHAHYLTAYEHLFRRASEDFGTVLEIGCDGGGGILTYADWVASYGNPKAINRNYVSCDIAPRPPSLDLNPAISHHQIDAYKPESVAMLEMYAPFVIQIDDGPHTLGSQIFFAQNFPKMLSENGIAIIEDVQKTEHIPQLHGALPPGFVGFAVDLRFTDDRYDSSLFVIQRA